MPEGMERKEMKKLTITTSTEISDEEKAKIEKVFSAKYDEEIYPVYLIDEAIIGGIIVFDGDKVYDGSIRNQLTKLSGSLSK